MKKIIVLPLLVIGFLQASGVTEATVPTQIQTMQGLENGMTLIQKGNR